MKVLHISKYDCKGGAAIAALNAVRAQREIGIDAIMLAGRKLGDDPNVVGPGPVAGILAHVRFAIERLPARIAGLPRTDTRSIGVAGIRLRSALRKFKPDIVVLHNIDGLVKLEDLPKIDVPVVWRMHDAWPLLGTRHYQQGGGPSRFSGLFAKIDLWTEQRKRQALAKMPSLTLAPPSEWLERANPILPCPLFPTASIPACSFLIPIGMGQGAISAWETMISLSFSGRRPEKPTRERALTCLKMRWQSPMPLLASTG